MASSRQRSRAKEDEGDASDMVLMKDEGGGFDKREKVRKSV